MGDRAQSKRILCLGPSRCETKCCPFCRLHSTTRARTEFVSSAKWRRHSTLCELGGRAHHKWRFKGTKKRKIIKKKRNFRCYVLVSRAAVERTATVIRTRTKAAAAPTPSRDLGAAFSMAGPTPIPARSSFSFLLSLSLSESCCCTPPLLYSLLLEIEGERNRPNIPTLITARNARCSHQTRGCMAQ